MALCVMGCDDAMSLLILRTMTWAFNVCRQQSKRQQTKTLLSRTCYIDWCNTSMLTTLSLFTLIVNAKELESKQWGKKKTCWGEVKYQVDPTKSDKSFRGWDDCCANDVSGNNINEKVMCMKTLSPSRKENNWAQRFYWSTVWTTFGPVAGPTVH